MQESFFLLLLPPILLRTLLLVSLMHAAFRPVSGDMGGEAMPPHTLSSGRTNLGKYSGDLGSVFVGGEATNLTGALAYCIPASCCAV
jgi:hypothetical protein